ncbi:MAG: hypothetical protein JW969_17870 [Spirochaetales bacterium]|nr:hypothetical protein [Spirochaetales bacterium]
MKKLILLTLFFLPCIVFAQGIGMGDVNNSGEIDIVDALLIAQAYVDLNPANYDSSKADVSADGNIDIVDALLVAQCYVGIISCDFGGTTEDNITVRARGTMGGENMELHVDGTVVASWTMTTSYVDYTASGTGVIEVYFTNDDQEANGMDIQVDYIIYNGTTFQAEDQEINTGVYVNGSCGGSYSDMLQCDGYIRFNTDPGATSPPETPIPTAAPGETPAPTTPPGTCNIPAMPSFSSLPNITELPNPFKFMDGSTMTRKDEWTCRRAEISALHQRFVYGEKPAVPTVTGSFSGGRITVNVTYSGKSISFSCSITKPSGTGPFPAMIGIGGASIGSFSGVASITFPNDEIAAQSGSGSRGQGKFYTLYGSGHSAGATMAWAWGVDCLITALEQTPSAGIDPTKLGVTGCSRNGKGALVVGAFCDRIALTIPQESGCGGASSWRVADYRKSQGANIQTLCQIIGENPWMSANLDQFCNNTNKLPVDNHELIALCAPRAVLVIGNNIDWLGPQSVYASSVAAHYVFEALGIPGNMGYSISTNHGHCSLPSSQSPDVNAFVTKFLLGGSSNTNITRDDNNFSFDKNRWAPWSVPSLQ